MGPYEHPIQPSRTLEPIKQNPKPIRMPSHPWKRKKAA